MALVEMAAKESRVREARTTASSEEANADCRVATSVADVVVAVNDASHRTTVLRAVSRVVKPRKTVVRL